ncbi:hypothetical protein FC093_21000, partial [Ilyomonas limi]
MWYGKNDSAIKFNCTAFNITDAIQQALRIENEQKAIRAKAENDIIEAKRDSAVLVIGALSEARAIREKQNALTPEYVEYQKVLK